MNADLDLKITLGELQAESNIHLSNLKVRAAEKKPQAGQSAGLKMPLESTLRLLRDRNNDIDLKVPITGDIADPEFSFSDAINQAVVKALAMASISYLKYALGPYGVAIGVAELAWKAVHGIRLKPVVFNPGSSDLKEDAAAYLQQVAAILKDRPGLKIAVCGLATEKDRSFLSKTHQNQGAGGSSIDDKLLEQARKRAEVIEDHLVSDYEIKNNRIFICNRSSIKMPKDNRVRSFWFRANACV